MAFPWMPVWIPRTLWKHSKSAMTSQIFQKSHLFVDVFRKMLRKFVLPFNLLYYTAHVGLERFFRLFLLYSEQTRNTNPYKDKATQSRTRSINQCLVITISTWARISFRRIIQRCFQRRQKAARLTNTSKHRQTFPVSKMLHWYCSKSSRRRCRWLEAVSLSSKLSEVFIEANHLRHTTASYWAYPAVTFFLVSRTF